MSEMIYGKVWYEMFLTEQSAETISFSKDRAHLYSPYLRKNSPEQIVKEIAERDLSHVRDVWKGDVTRCIALYDEQGRPLGVRRFVYNCDSGKASVEVGGDK